MILPIRPGHHYEIGQRIKPDGYLFWAMEVVELHYDHVIIAWLSVGRMRRKMEKLVLESGDYEYEVV